MTEKNDKFCRHLRCGMFCVAAFVVGWLAGNRLDCALVLASFDRAIQVAIAVGTVGAVCVALFNNHKAQLSRRREPLISLNAVIHHAIFLISGLPDKAPPGRYAKHYFSNVENIREFHAARSALEQFPTERITDYSAIQSKLQMLRALSFVDPVVDSISERNLPWGGDQSRYQSAIANAKAAAELSRSLMDTALDGAGVRTS